MAIETIYVAIQTIIYTLILYSMIGFEWKITKFIWFYYYILMCFIYFTMYGMMVVALTPGHQIAAIVMSFFLSFWNLFSGFLIPRPVCDITSNYTLHNASVILEFLFVFAYKGSSHFSICCSKSQSGGDGIIGLHLWLGHFMAL